MTDAAANSNSLGDRLTVRELTPRDADAVRELDDRILGQDRSSGWAEFVEQFLASSRLSVMAIPSWGSHVAEVDGGVVGFILSQRQAAGYGLPTGVRIVAIAVDPDYRSHGIGRALVEALKARCRQSGVTAIYSILNRDDERDANFLSACDFKPAPLRVFVHEL